MSTERYPTSVDGRVHEPGEARVSTDDVGFQLGLAVFETVLYRGGVAVYVEEHLERLAEGARALGIEVRAERDPARALERYLPALDAALERRGLDEAALRIVLTRGAPAGGPCLVVAARDVVRPPADGIAVSVEPRAKLSGDPLEQVKSSSRLRNVLALESARAQGAWDALLGNELDEVCEATVANVFAVLDGAVVTPATDRGCLPGIQRGKILSELARPRPGAPRVVVGRLPLADLVRASEVFLSNSTGGVIPVRTVLGVVDGLAGPAGAVFREVSERIRELEERYRASHAR